MRFLIVKCSLKIRLLRICKSKTDWWNAEKGNSLSTFWKRTNVASGKKNNKKAYIFNLLCLFLLFFYEILLLEPFQKKKKAAGMIVTSQSNFTLDTTQPLSQPREGWLSRRYIWSTCSSQRCSLWRDTTPWPWWSFIATINLFLQVRSHAQW